MDPSIDQPGESVDHVGALLEARAARYAVAAEAAETVVGKAMGFRRGEGHYAAPLEFLKAVRPLGDFCALVGASATVPGVLHHRGELLSVHDLAGYVGRDAPAKPEWAVILESHDERIALMCDDVTDVLLLEKRLLAPVPVGFGDSAEGFAGLYAGRTLLLEVPSLLLSMRFMDAY